MKKTPSLFLALLLVAGWGHTAHARSKDHALVVMPVRYTVVQFAFDVARIRPVALLAYDKGTGDEPLLLHVWDATINNWKPADIAAYRDGSLFPKTPKSIILIGGEDDLPAELAAAPAWAKEVTTIPSLKVLDMANAMNKELKFSKREWKRLAQRHNLKLVDKNAERRRYGRYGKPGTTYTGPRPVNPLIARFSSDKQDKSTTEEATDEAVEDAADLETVDGEATAGEATPEAINDTDTPPAVVEKTEDETTVDATAKPVDVIAPDEK